MLDSLITVTIRGYTCSVVVLLNYASLPATLTPSRDGALVRASREGKLARRGHYDVIDGAVAAPGRGLLDLTHHVQALHHGPEHNVPPVQPRRGRRGDKKLRAVRVRPRVRHGEHAGPDVVELIKRERLIRELSPVDGVPAGPVSALEIAALDHEVGDDAMEDGVLVAEVALARRELSEVLHRLGHLLAEEADDDTALGGTADRDVEVHLVRHLGVAKQRRGIRRRAAVSERGSDRGRSDGGGRADEGGTTGGCGLAFLRLGVADSLARDDPALRATANGGGDRGGDAHLGRLKPACVTAWRFTRDQR